MILSLFLAGHSGRMFSFHLTTHSLWVRISRMNEVLFKILIYVVLISYDFGLWL